MYGIRISGQFNHVLKIVDQNCQEITRQSLAFVICETADHSFWCCKAGVFFWIGFTAADSRLGMSVLARLDKMAEAGGPATHARARIASQDFAGFLDLVEEGGDADDVEAFVGESAPQCELAPKSAENARAPATQKQLSEMAAIITHGEPMPEEAFPNIRNRADRRRLAAIMAKRGNQGLADRFAAG